MLKNAQKDFIQRHIGPSVDEQNIMLKELGYKNLDELIKDTVPFDVYDGSGFQLGISAEAIDFRRTVLHELGHVIGLEHEESQESIMRSKYGDIFALQPDDIAGANKLYTGISNCEVKRLKFGRTADALKSPDCTQRVVAIKDMKTKQ